MRHDIPNIGTMSEAYPHLIFHNFKTRLGKRVSYHGLWRAVSAFVWKVSDFSLWNSAISSLFFAMFQHVRIIEWLFIEHCEAQQGTTKTAELLKASFWMLFLECASEFYIQCVPPSPSPLWPLGLQNLTCSQVPSYRSQKGIYDVAEWCLVPLLCWNRMLVSSHCKLNAIF